MATQEELTASIGMLRTELQAMAAWHTSRMEPVESEVVKLFVAKIEDKDANRGRDLFVVNRGFGSLPSLDGRVNK